MHDISVLHYILLSLDPQLPDLLQRRLSFVFL
jgi:hypothetical protein